MLNVFGIIGKKVLFSFIWYGRVFHNLNVYSALRFIKTLRQVQLTLVGIKTFQSTNLSL